MPRLLVIGSSNTDMTVRLPALPAPGETVLGGSLLTGPGGKGANQAVAAARAGADVVFVGAVGGDAFGAAAVAHYRNEGIDVSHLKRVSSSASGVALIFVGEQGENMIGVAPGANDHLTAADIANLPDSLFPARGVMLIAGLEVPLDTVASAVLRARQAGMKVVLNPAPASRKLLAAGILDGVDVVTPNRGELGLLTGSSVERTEEVAEAARRLGALGPACVLTTLGAGGCHIVDRADPTGDVLVPAFRVAPVDTVGAGDAFSATLAVGLAEGRSILEAARWASAAAALTATRPGAQNSLPHRPEIERLYRTGALD